jgi:hypothetical protein
LRTGPASEKSHSRVFTFIQTGMQRSRLPFIVAG